MWLTAELEISFGVIFLVLVVGKMFAAKSSCVTCGMCTNTLGDVHLGGEGRTVTGVRVGRGLV